MDPQLFRNRERSLKWIVFLAVLACVTLWAVRNVVVRAQRMRTASTSISTFTSSPPGSSIKAVVRLDTVNGKELQGTLLERKSDTVYRLPSDKSAAVHAVLTTHASVLMGKVDDVVAGGVVELSGILDADHVLQASQVVILTNYIRLLRKAG